MSFHKAVGSSTGRILVRDQPRSEENKELSTVLRCNGIQHTIADAEELRQQLQKIKQEDFAEVWLERGTEVMSLLTNRGRDRAFLMFLTNDNPAGFHAISGNEAEVEEAMKFLLDNGQVDEFDLSDTIPLPDGIRAFEYFALHGGRASFILWHDDSL